jgi:hypothetical protein
MGYYDDFSFMRRFSEQLRDPLEQFRRQEKALQDITKLDRVAGLPDDLVTGRLRENVAAGLAHASEISSAAEAVRDVQNSLALQAADVKGLYGDTALLAGATSDAVSLSRAYWDSPAYKLTRDLEEQMRSLHSAGAGVSRSLEAAAVNLMRSRPIEFDSWRDALVRATRGLIDQYNLATGATTAQVLRQHSSWIEALQKAASPALSMLTHDLVSGLAQGGLSPALAGGFASELIGHFSQAAKPQTEEDFQDFLRKLVTWFTEQNNRLPGGQVSFKALLSILLTLIALLCAPLALQQEGPDTQQAEPQGDHRKYIAETETRILQSLATLRGQEADRPQLVVSEATQLRVGPSEDVPTLRSLPPQIPVFEIERQGDWVHVEFFDYTEGEQASGWISSKSLIPFGE